MRALRIADNQLAALAGWDEEPLGPEFGELLTGEFELKLSFDVEVTGFPSAEIDRLADQAQAPRGDRDDALPAPTAPSVASSVSCR